jgi:hypothetical protein
MIRNRYLAAAVLVVALAALLYWWQYPPGTVSATYDPVINPNDFVTEVNHKYLTLKPGTKFVYEKKHGTKIERTEVVVTNETKLVMGVPTVVVRATEWQGDVMKEDTRDWYAQDKAGNVWYFGEAVDNYKGGELRDHGGSWEAGVDGAKPGIIMPKTPTAGQTYRQEYLKGKSEDVGTIVAVGMRIAVPHGTYDDCVQVKDWSLIKYEQEYKYFCAGAGFAVREEEAGLGRLFDWEKSELVKVTSE